MQASDVMATAGGSQAKDGRRMASLDGLRAIAALSVFAFHGWLYTKPVPLTSDRSSAGDYAAHELRLGLVLFFVLTGYLLARPWFSAALEGRERPDVRRYVRSRAARIAPAYYTALIGSIGLLWGLAGSPGVRLPPADQLPLFFLFAQNTSTSTVLKLDPPMWSLAIEVSFYAVLPVIGWLAVQLAPRRRVQALVPLALLGVGVAWNWWLAGRGLDLTFSKTLVGTLPYFAVGMLAMIALHGRLPGAATRRAMMLAGLVLVVADAAIKGTVAAAGIGMPVILVVLRDLPSAIGFALIIGAAAAHPDGRVLGSRALAGLGTISYGFYLWHVPVLVFLRGHGLLPLDPLLGSLTALGPALGVSALSWIALEKPAIAWAARRNERARTERRDRVATAALRSGGGGVDRRAGGREVSTLRA